ncbi:hypothetical protein HD597_008530 [Nonomuraea thailandensis]|uniref:Uncharacterized protein n=1 Tax=Nonomuraea thailandensis TaxID=1188745 RepID=A0A9X2K6I0_9ACTN|nr:hypothetical protein [Nonomuraea thailandensis]MCP2361510.1 hypothetical protein [Nonomuraea thailandensis]
MRFTSKGGGEADTMTMNIIYRDWGKPVGITAPPERLLTDEL